MAEISQQLLAPLKRVREFIFGRARQAAEGGCMICLAGHPDLIRLAQIIGKLPIGKWVVLPKVRKGLDANFKTVTADLNYMIEELRLPIDRSERGIMLKEPVCLCEFHARIADKESNRFGNATTRRGVDTDTAGDQDLNPDSPPL